MARNLDINDLDNVFDNAIDNIKQLFELYEKDELDTRFDKIYIEDIANPVPNSIAIDIDGHSVDLRSWIGKTRRNFTIGINVNIWYFHEELNANTRKREIINMMWKINQMFMKHTSVNGFCDELGCTISGSEYIARKYGSKIMACGLIRIVLKRLHSVNSLD